MDQLTWQNLLRALGVDKFEEGQQFGNHNPGLYGSENSTHRGVDIKTPTGTLLRMPFTSTVTALSEADSGGFGNALKIKLQDGGELILGHLSEFVGIKPGETKQFASGDPIGKTGNTGKSTGPHLHIEHQPVAGRYSYTAINPKTPLMVKRGSLLASLQFASSGSEAVSAVSDAAGDAVGAVTGAAGNAMQDGLAAFAGSPVGISIGGGLAALGLLLCGVLLLGLSFVGGE